MIQDLGCTSQDESAATHVLTELLGELGVGGVVVRCLYSSQKQLYIKYTGMVINLDAAAALNKEAERRGLPSTTCGDSSVQCWIKLSYSGDDQALILDQKNRVDTNDQIVANLNVLLGLETPTTTAAAAATTTTTTTTTTIRPASSFPGPNVEELKCNTAKGMDNRVKTTNCGNVKANDGRIFRTSGGTQFLEEYFAIHNPGWEGSGTITCSNVAKEASWGSTLHDIMFEDLELCVDLITRIPPIVFVEGYGYGDGWVDLDPRIEPIENVVECVEDGEFTFLRYLEDGYCKDMNGISTLTLITAATTVKTTAAATTTINNKGGGSNSGGDEPVDTNNYSNIDNNGNTTANGNSSTPPTEPHKLSSFTGTIIGVLAVLVVVFAVVGFILWRQNNSAGGGGGIPHIISNAAPATPANGAHVGGVPSIYHNRMYTIDGEQPTERPSSQPYSKGTGRHGSIVYSIPLEDDGSSGGSGSGGGGGGGGDRGAGGAGGGTMLVSTANQNALQYATVDESGSTAASSYSVISPKGAAQQDAPAMLYDVAQHAGGGSAIPQSAEYSHLAPRGGVAGGGEQNNMYDLGPQQRGGGSGGGGGGSGGERNNMYDLGPQQRGGGSAGDEEAMYEEPDSNA